MGYDYWHQVRLLRIRDTNQDLGFGNSRFVVGPVVAIPEPIWRTLVVTAVHDGVPDVFSVWDWDSPLSEPAARTVAQTLREVAERVERSGAIEFPSELASDSLPDSASVAAALHVLSSLLNRAAEQHREVEIWVD